MDRNPSELATHPAKRIGQPEPKAGNWPSAGHQQYAWGFLLAHTKRLDVSSACVEPKLLPAGDRGIDDLPRLLNRRNGLIDEQLPRLAPLVLSDDRPQPLAWILGMARQQRQHAGERNVCACVPTTVCPSPATVATGDVPRLALLA